MSHLDPDQLALLAIGEPVASPDELAHLASCSTCAAELSEMTRTVRIARSTLGEDALESPPDRVWASISAELGLSSTSEAGGDDVSESDEPSDEPRASADGGVTETSARPERRRRVIRAIWVLAASLVLIAGVALGTTWAVTSRLAPTPIAEASLDAFPAHVGAVGTADVEQRRDGSRTLVVTLETDDVPDTYREVWLIRNDAAALISLGVLDGDQGTFPIPDGVDLTDYSLVDISVEHIDGDPAHSGDSIVRGKLTFA
ncbi:anti-sigma factor [Microbacterium pumilum]|uniref:Anti-sigma K factor RskA C-terminal domain-containing protein n=1 Tax=Microbacterium pumilum TaxID=344165 RepID=A0ABN2S557_9MICO